MKPGNASKKKAASRKRSGGSAGGPLVHLFDGHVYIFRAYYSLPPMTASDGTPCNAAYGFANTLLRYAAEEDPSHVGVCFDAAMTSFRNEVEPEYKAQRGEPPDDLEPQFDLCHEISVALGFATYEVEGYEADDLLGTIADEVLRRKGSARVRVRVWGCVNWEAGAGCRASKLRCQHFAVLAPMRRRCRNGTFTGMLMRLSLIHI